MSDKQTPLLDPKEYDVNYVDIDQDLSIPEDPLVFKAQKLQVLVQRLDNLAASSPQQFSTERYISALDEYMKACEKLLQRKGISNGDDTGAVEEEIPEGDSASPVRPEPSSGLDFGVPTEDPVSG